MQRHPIIAHVSLHWICFATHEQVLQALNAAKFGSRLNNKLLFVRSCLLTESKF